MSAPVYLIFPFVITLKIGISTQWSAYKTFIIMSFYATIDFQCVHIFFYWHTSLKITIWFHCETFCLETFLTRRKLKIPFFMTNSEGFWLINSLLLCASVIIFHFSLIHLSQHICTRQKILPDFMLYEVIISKNCRLMLALKSPISTLYLEVILTHKF